MALVHSAKIGVTPLFMQTIAGEDPINYSAANFRQLITSMWPNGGGVLGPTSFRVTQADTVGWSIKVTGGAAIVGNATTSYLVTSDSAQTINLAGAIQTSVIATQYHYVFLEIVDKTVLGGDGYYADIVVGTDSGAGYAQPEGAAYLLLGTVAVSPGQSNIQNSHISAKPPNASHGGKFENLAGYLTNGIVSAHTTYDRVSVARMRYAAGQVRFTGGLRRTATADFTKNDYTPLGTVPWYLKPNSQVWMAAAAGGGTLPTYHLSIDTDGVMSAFVPTQTTAPKTLFLDGVSYEVD